MLIAGPSPFSAEHQYSPDSPLFGVKLKVSPRDTVVPSLIHTIFGFGLPVALQVNVTSSASTTVLSEGFMEKLGGSIKEGVKFAASL